MMIIMMTVVMDMEEDNTKSLVFNTREYQIIGYSLFFANLTLNFC